MFLVDGGAPSSVEGNAGKKHFFTQMGGGNDGSVEDHGGVGEL